MMSRREATFLSGIFLLLITLPGLSGLLGVGLESTEKRAREPWPQALSERFLPELKAALEDRLGFRGFAIELDARLDLRLFGDSPRPARVWRGEEDWLFLTGLWRQPCAQSWLDAEKALEILGRISRRVEASGRRFRLVVAPDKFSIEGARLGSRLREVPNCGPAQRRALEEALRAGEVRGAVDLWTPLRDLQDREELYYHGDIHWRPRGAGILVRELVESLEPGLWQPEFLVRGFDSGRRAGTLAFLGIPAFEEAEGVTVRRPGTRVLELREERWREGAWQHRQPRLELDGERLSSKTLERLGTPRILWRTTGGERIDERVTMIFDSFAWDALPMLAEYIADARLLTWQEGLTGLGAEDFAWAETIVVESVEYVLWNRLTQLHGVILRGLDPDGGERLELKIKEAKIKDGRRGRPRWLLHPRPANEARTVVFELDTLGPARLRIAAWKGREALPKTDLWLDQGPPQLVAFDLESGVDRLMVWSGREGVEVLDAWLYRALP